ncbi:outer membrane beta-barrel protein [Thalassotalea nanhaiensis]|uniref:Outer membrane beta-barrel protein n=1 Tax=Thalassotalea nanhaiensis TaxID=3065648 RepID=A0ABY9TLF5_9GAMM|nr:outer membrane beta-barrel protein [Colwelliaceae bacterium SQ345]
MMFFGRSIVVSIFVYQMIFLSLVPKTVFAFFQDGIPFAGFKLHSQINVTESYTDNLLQDDDNKINTWKTFINPNVSLSKTYGLNQVEFGYGLLHSNYSAKGRDNITDHKFHLNSALDFNTSHRLKLSAQYNIMYEERGKDYSIGYGDLLKKPTEYKSLTAKSLYTYGAKSAKANVDVSLGYYEVLWEKLSISDLTIGPPTDTSLIDLTADREHEITSVGSTFRYKTGAYTEVNTSITYQDINYHHATGLVDNRDSEVSSAFVGLKWQGSALTTGFVNVGYSSKTFDSQYRSDESGFRWQLGVIWKPLTYSNFDFSSAQNVTEAKGQGSYIKNTNYTVSWHHQWLTRLKTKLSTRVMNDEYGDSFREDDVDIYSATVTYQMRKNLAFSSSLKHHIRDSNIEKLTFTENIISVSMKFAL